VAVKKFVGLLPCLTTPDLERQSAQSGLVRLITFLVVELTHLNLNSRFDMSVIFMTNYFLVDDDVPIDCDALLVTNFVNLKIKLTHSFGCAHRGRMCICIYMGE
jgi:hypothetical protein